MLFYLYAQFEINFTGDVGLMLVSQKSQKKFKYYQYAHAGP